jgi:membrane protease subunit HflC
MKETPLYLLLGLAAVLIIATQAFFIVDQREQAIVLQLGQPVGDTAGPGLHVKIPFIQSVRFFDRRILSVDPLPEQVVISSGIARRMNRGAAPEAAPAPAPATGEAPPIENVSGEPIIVDTFARYRIVDPLQFTKTLRTLLAAEARLETILNDTTRAVLGRTTLKELLSEDRSKITDLIQSRVNQKITEDKLGIEIIDVRIVRADLTADLRTSTVRRMISELVERATETRAKGEERALEIRSTADKERTVILAEAERDAQILRGEGDKQAIKTYADAFNTDKNFYSFVRSMEAYKNTLANPETQMILSPRSEFFRYFRNGSGTAE